MTFFTGEYRHNLDSKNRIIVPAKLRDQLGESFKVTKGYDGCLSIYTDEGFENMTKDIATLPFAMDKARDYMRVIYRNTTEGTIDSQGRLQLPQFLVNDIKLKKEAVIIGVGDHVEIWSEEHWEDYNEKASAAFESNAQQLADLLKK